MAIFHRTPGQTGLNNITRYALFLNMNADFKFCFGRSIIFPRLFFMVVVCISLTGCQGENGAASGSVEVKKLEVSALTHQMQTAGDPLVVVMMASWCRPCREEIPVLNKLYEKYKEKGVRFMGVGIDEGTSRDFAKMVNKYKARFPVYWVGEKAVSQLKVFGVPMFFFIKDGKIMEQFPGKQTRGFLERKIQTLMQ